MHKKQHRQRTELAATKTEKETETSRERKNYAESNRRKQFDKWLQYIAEIVQCNETKTNILIFCCQELLRLKQQTGEPTCGFSHIYGEIIEFYKKRTTNIKNKPRKQRKQIHELQKNILRFFLPFYLFAFFLFFFVETTKKKFFIFSNVLCRYVVCACVCVFFF